MAKRPFRKCIIQKYLIPFAAAIAVVLLFTAINMRRKTITVIVNGERKRIITYRSTVSQVLKTNDIFVNPKDKINLPLDSKLIDNQSIIIKRAVNVKVTVDGTEISLLSSEDSIGSMLSTEGIILRDKDKVIPDKSTCLTDGMNVRVVRVDVKSISETAPIQFREIIKADKSMANTKQYISQEGKEGEKEVAIQITYEDGKEVSRQVIGETVIKKPQDRIVIKGTYPYMPVSRSGNIMSYSRVFDVRATAYWAVSGIGRTYTASGRKAVWNPEGYSTIAVDPRIIPYGTKLFVQGYGFAIAADTGTAIKGNRVDVYFNTYKQACSWGAKHVKVYILK